MMDPRGPGVGEWERLHPCSGGRRIVTLDSQHKHMCACSACQMIQGHVSPIFSFFFCLNGKQQFPPFLVIADDLIISPESCYFILFYFKTQKKYTVLILNSKMSGL